jgi:glucokinase
VTAAIGLDIGGTKTAAALVYDDGTVGRLLRVATPAAAGPAAVLATAADLARQLLHAAGTVPLACGVGTAGAVDPTGRIGHATATLPGWTGTDVGAALSDALDLPVTVLNDVHAMAVGEARHGAARGTPDVLVVAAGTGIGGALIQHGSLLVGRHGLAGSVGHLPAVRRDGRRCSCGGYDHVESYAAGPAIAADYATRAGLSAVPPLERVGHAARDEDPAALAALTDGGQVLGAGLAAAANLLDPALIVLGGGVLGLGPRFVDAVEYALRESALPGPDQIPLRTAALGPAAVLAGAARAALDAAVDTS